MLLANKQYVVSETALHNLNQYRRTLQVNPYNQTAADCEMRYTVPSDPGAFVQLAGSVAEPELSEPYHFDPRTGTVSLL
jgi:hypothetical protein